MLFQILYHTVSSASFKFSTNISKASKFIFFISKVHITYYLCKVLKTKVKQSLYQSWFWAPERFLSVPKNCQKCAITACKLWLNPEMHRLLSWKVLIIILICFYDSGRKRKWGFRFCFYILKEIICIIISWKKSSALYPLWFLPEVRVHRLSSRKMEHFSCHLIQHIYQKTFLICWYLLLEKAKSSIFHSLKRKKYTEYFTRSEQG